LKQQKNPAARRGFLFGIRGNNGMCFTKHEANIAIISAASSLTFVTLTFKKS
jgi:hypothetical protein